jgi:hypothetical protein
MKRKAVWKVGAFPTIIATAFLLHLSCSSSQEVFSIPPHAADEWIALVGKTIPDQQRAARVGELGLQLIALSDSMKAEVQQLSAKAVALSENYSCTKEEMQRVMDQFTGVRNRTLSRYRDAVFAMRSQVNEREWKKLTD